MWRQTKVAIKLLAHPADVFIDGSGEPHGFLDDHDRRGALHAAREHCAHSLFRAHDPCALKPAVLRLRDQGVGELVEVLLVRARQLSLFVLLVFEDAEHFTVCPSL